MSVAATITFGNSFASKLPELAIGWQAETFPDARLLVLNDPLAAELGLDAEWLRGAEGVRLLVGNWLPEGATPVAQAYAGHQFGGYAPRLGDGRALLLGEVRDAEGQWRDLHLKGSGKTPFARGGDGLAAIGPMLREYVLSEAMHALGIPTTRSLAVTATGQQVLRDVPLPGAVLCRVASSHLRVGSFQYARAGGNTDLLRRLADLAIARHYPAAGAADQPYEALFAAVVTAQAKLIARWMLVGFIHGVMNTDNMTISGETIDYGPCAFLDAFDPTTVFSSIDHAGRYSFGNQPLIAEWNLARLGETLLPLIDENQDRAIERATQLLVGFRRQYSDAWSAGMSAKLGLPEAVDTAVCDALTNDLLGLIREERVDWTNLFRALSALVRGDAQPARNLFLDRASFDDWAERWLAVEPDADGMDQVNPVYIPRNHLVEEALTAATDGDLDPLERLLEAVRAPYDIRPGLERYAEPAPETFGPYQTFCGT